MKQNLSFFHFRFLLLFYVKYISKHENILKRGNNKKKKIKMC